MLAAMWQSKLCGYTCMLAAMWQSKLCGYTCMLAAMLAKVVLKKLGGSYGY